jgi:hypothetical protein
MTRILIYFLLLSNTAFGQTTLKESGNKTTIKEWKTLDQPGYTIKYPSTWELNQSGQMATSFIIFAPLELMQIESTGSVNIIRNKSTCSFVFTIKQHQARPALLIVYCLLCPKIFSTFFKGIRIMLTDLQCFGRISQEPQFRNISHKQEVTVYEYTITTVILQVRY